MSIRILALVGFYVFTLSCKNSSKQTPTSDIKVEAKNSNTLTEIDINKIKYTDFSLDQRAAPLVESWESYLQLNTTLAAIKTADFSFFSSDEKATKDLTKALKTELPDTLNTPAIYARVKVVETMLHKLEDASTLTNIPKQDVALAVKDVLISVSNLNFQINKKIEKDSRKIVRPY